MSYDITVETPHQTFSMNWLRNPFGLCCFAEDNVGDGAQSLWHVCNDHSYDKSNDIDRKQFLQVVEDYWDRLRGLQKGFFHFDFGAYVQFVSDYPQLIKKNVFDTAFLWEPPRSSKPAAPFASPLPKLLSESLTQERLKVDVERFHRCRGFRFDPQITVLAWYKKWFDELVTLARAMQDPEATVFISN